MKIYKVVLGGSEPHYIIAENFDDAYRIAGKILAKAFKNWKDAEITSITEQFELEVVK